jgi:hypothetical protein
LEENGEVNKMVEEDIWIIFCFILKELIVNIL